MIDLKDYEENKVQRCFDKWMKIPPVQNALTKLDNPSQAMEVAVKLEENRVHFLKDGNDKYLDNVLKFIELQAL
jgi:hypothetical protein